jgi:spore germination protein KC/spore germination protein
MPDGNGKVSIEIRNVKSKIIPAVKSDGVYITMKIDERGDISENTSSEDESNPEIIKKFERIQEDVIKKEVISTLEKARQINADVFGFGDIIYMYHPKEWNKMQTNWQENFKNIKVNVNVKASIERSGKIIKSIKSKDI